MNRTRSKKQRLDLQAARQAFGGKMCIRLSNLDEVSLFLALCKEDKDAATGLLFLHLEMPVLDSLRSVRGLYAQARFITILRIDLPMRSSTYLPRTIQFPNLVTFRSSSPHRYLKTFLLAHPQLIDLELGSCGTMKSCALAGIVMPELSDLDCPPSCVQGIARNNFLHRIVTTYHSFHDLNSPTSDVFKAGLYRAAVITVLHTNFDPHNAHFLDQIAVAAPHLTELKLTQSTYSASHADQPLDPIWKPLIHPTYQLQQLSCLRYLCIRTNEPLVRQELDQDGLIMSWLPADTAGSTYAGSIRYPALERLLLWSGSTHGNPTVAEWALRDGKWVKRVLDCRDVII